MARFRQRTYLVDDEIVNRKWSVDGRLVRPSCEADDYSDHPPEVLWEKKLDPVIVTGEARESVAQKGFDDSRLFTTHLYKSKRNFGSARALGLIQPSLPTGIRLDSCRHRRHNAVFVIPVPVRPADTTPENTGVGPICRCEEPRS